MITRNQFRGIVKQAVIDMAYNPGYTVNTYAQVDGPPDLEGDAFGYTFEAYEQGFFWSRKWVLMDGANPDNIRGQFPALFDELRYTQPKDIERPDVVRRFAWVIVDKIDCPECPASLIRTGPVVQDAMEDVARGLLKEVANYRLYRNNEGSEWLAPGRAAARGYSDTDEVEHLLDYIDEERPTVKPWGNMPGMRGVAVEITLKHCEPIALDFDYSEAPLERIGTNSCGC